MFFRSKQKKADEQMCLSVKQSCCDFFGHNVSEHVHVERVSDDAVNIRLGFVCDTEKSSLIAHLNEHFSAASQPDQSKANINKALSKAPLEFNVRYNVPIFDSKQPPVRNVKNIIAVSSGKGGVGKSATAVNLALALKAQGARVGILDADIYGPSIPLMLGTENASPMSPDNKHMMPIVAHGLVSNSIGYLVKNEHASIWRGPMASKALTQLVTETNWPLLDYLIVDMPPGTGDIQLTMAQQLPLTAAVVVTTPQDIALSDAQKGIAMFNKLQVPVLGLVENMSFFECPACHHQSHIFSSKGAQKLSAKYSLPILAEVPLAPLIREYADAGDSLFEQAPEHSLCAIYLRGAYLLSRQMASQLVISPLAQTSKIEVTQLN
ncbi:iron-sulfur cluster carrier protein ApbC [Glaciecola siphonariae]|uniref:Iron-sulfur cluster carrier protein n=1 Tax=Glaciecola siphonariae TaxID=521012 RepID=A0ABV9LSF4_9ALTE